MKSSRLIIYTLICVFCVDEDDDGSQSGLDRRNTIHFHFHYFFQKKAIRNNTTSVCFQRGIEGVLSLFQFFKIYYEAGQLQSMIKGIARNKETRNRNENLWDEGKKEEYKPLRWIRLLVGWWHRRGSGCRRHGGYCHLKKVLQITAGLEGGRID